MLAAVLTSQKPVRTSVAFEWVGSLFSGICSGLPSASGTDAELTPSVHSLSGATGIVLPPGACKAGYIHPDPSIRL